MLEAGSLEAIQRALPTARVRAQYVVPTGNGCRRRVDFDIELMVFTCSSRLMGHNITSCRSSSVVRPPNNASTHCSNSPLGTAVLIDR
eukprot:2243035-Rhodomonas_salina.1